MFMLFNPTFAMLHDEATDRYHPILFVEKSLPGNVNLGRMQSGGHHTAGFATRGEALASIDETIERMDQEVKKHLEEDIPWNSVEEPIPAQTLFMVPA